jgi:hypothetical protein
MAFYSESLKKGTHLRDMDGYTRIILKLDNLKVGRKDADWIYLAGDVSNDGFL